VVTVVDQVVAQEHREGVVADVVGRAQHRMAQPKRLTLSHVVDVAEVGGLAHPREPHLVALGLQRPLELPVAVEMILEGGLVAPGHHEDIPEPGPGGLLDDVLDRRLVDDRQHLLGRRLGRGQEPGTQPGGGNHGLGDGAPVRRG
jgi:hypothetical protein